MIVDCQNADTFLPGFYKHPSYAKMLVELELLKEPTFRENEDEENNSADEFMISSSESSVGGSPVKIVNKDAGTRIKNTVHALYCFLLTVNLFCCLMRMLTNF